MKRTLTVLLMLFVGTTARANLTEQAWRDLSHEKLSAQPTGSYPFRDCFRRAALVHQVPEALLIAVARGESNFDPAAVSNADAIGVMQIQWPETARHLGFRDRRQLFNACSNIEAGARYLRQLHGRFDGSWHRALAAYNYGPSRIGSGAIPDGAAWYSAYILRHLQQMTLAGEPVPLAQSPQVQHPSGDGSFTVLVFEKYWQLQNLMRWLGPKLADFRLEWHRRRDGRHEIRLAYGDATERLAAEHALTKILGFNPNRP